MSNFKLVLPFLGLLCICTSTAKDAKVLSEYEKFAKVHETAMKVLSNPDQAVDPNDPNSVMYLADLQRRMAITEGENGQVHSVAESVEYVLDHFKRAKKLEEKVSDLTYIFTYLAYKYTLKNLALFSEQCVNQLPKFGDKL